MHLVLGMHLALSALASATPRLSPSELADLYPKCAPTVAPETMAALVRVESGGNPYAIGVVGGHLERQPSTLEEAVATAESLDKLGWNFSVGLTQVNRFNLARFGLTYRTAFEPCGNLRAGSRILEECYVRAVGARPKDALAAAVSCYYSGNFERGFQREADGTPSYVELVLRRSFTDLRRQKPELDPARLRAMEAPKPEAAEATEAIPTSSAVVF